MEKKKTKMTENDIVFSQTMHAGNRIYYVDVKKTRSDEMFLSITESKKVAADKTLGSEFTLEKHKIFLYKEDFARFMEIMQHAVDYVTAAQGMPVPRNSASNEDNSAATEGLGDEIELNIEF